MACAAAVPTRGQAATRASGAPPNYTNNKPNRTPHPEPAATTGNAAHSRSNTAARASRAVCPLRGEALAASRCRTPPGARRRRPRRWRRPRRLPAPPWRVGARQRSGAARSAAARSSPLARPAAAAAATYSSLGAADLLILLGAPSRARRALSGGPLNPSGARRAASARRHARGRARRARGRTRGHTRRRARRCAQRCARRCARRRV